MSYLSLNSAHYWVEEYLPVQWLLTAVFAPERDRSGHVSAGAVATTEYFADATMFAKGALESIDHCVVLIELGWVPDFWGELVLDSVDLKTAMFGEHAQTVLKLVD